MSYLSPLSGLLAGAVKKAANSLNRDFNEIEKLQSSVKDSGGFVAAAYSRVEKDLKKELSGVRPDFVYKEIGKPLPKGACFVVSPIDGLDNFARGIAHFAVSVAACNNGDVIAGQVYNPVSGELFFTEKGKGAYREGPGGVERLRISAGRELKTAMISTVVPFKKNISEYNNLHAKIASVTSGLRNFGAISLDLAYAASGKLDAALGLGCRVEDITAGLLLVKESGGYVYGPGQEDFNEDGLNLALKSGDVLAVNPNLNKKVYDLLHNK
jgi:myo-inositol-1(or 4)-monophosphatase